MQDPSGEPSAPTTVYVCVTCRSEGETDPVRSGRRLHDALAAAFGADPAVVLGTRSEDQAAILGYAPRAELVHRNHLALL